MATFSDILRAVADHYQVPSEKLVEPPPNGRRGSAKYTEARGVAMYLARDMLQLSFPEVAKLFNRSHHTTALFAIRTAEEKVSPEVFAAIRERIASPTKNDGCPKCRLLLVELAQMKLEILEMRARLNGCG